MEKLRKRESGIELLKILAMLLIVINHVTQTIVTKNPCFESDYVYSIGKATTNIVPLILSYMRTFGGQGNIMFLVCSAWFLVDSQKIKVQKVFSIIFDVWVINFIFLITFKFASSAPIGTSEFIKCLFPTTYNLNWYITCYLLLYLIHIFLNKIIDSFSQKTLLSICIVTLSLYFGIDFVLKSKFFSSHIIGFVVVYFTIAYVKKYMPEFCENRKYNVILLIAGVLGTVFVLLATNYLGLYISMFDNSIGRWFVNFSPFYLMTSVALFNLFKGIKLKNSAINYVSSLSLIVYIIHENHLFRKYGRPVFCVLFENSNFYNEHIVLFDLAFSVALFAASILLSCLYKILLQPIVQKLSEKAYKCFSLAFNKIEDKIIKIK